jgi:GNAT superfamily N-acetyltransferase
MMNVRIRRGAETDAHAAAELYLRARKAAIGTIPPSVHDDDGAAVGILVLDGPWVDQLYVEPAMRRRGTGTRLIEFAKRERPAGLRLWTFAPDVLYVWA